MNQPSKCFFCLLLPALVIASHSNASAANRFGATTLENITTAKITYVYRWGKHGQWKSVTLGPKRTLTHFWPYRYRNENASPKLYVRFDADSGTTQRVELYYLSRKAVPDKAPNSGAHYRFQFDGPTKTYVDLLKVGQRKAPKGSPSYPAPRRKPLQLLGI